MIFMTAKDRMKLYFVSLEYEDNWRDLQGIFDTKEKADAVNEILNGGTGDVHEFELNKIKDLDSRNLKQKLIDLGVIE